MATMTAARSRPCPKCPFRTDVPNYLRAGRRVEIATAIANGYGFPCHETTEHHEDDEGNSERVATQESKFCAGAIKAALAAGGVPQDLRIMARLGFIDLDAIEANGAECWNLTAWASPHRGNGDGRPADDEGEPCSYSGPRCKAPAGHLIDGIAVPGDVMADNGCGECGDALCDECITADGLCPPCHEELHGEEDHDDRPGRRGLD